MRKKIKMILAIVLCLGMTSGIGTGFMILETINQSALARERSNVDYWRGMYDDKSDENDDLFQDYINLVTMYNDLFSSHESLQVLLDSFEHPLTSPVIPTKQEVIDWLAIDDTESFYYNDNPDIWICGDFAAMLMTRAKAMNWRMRIAIVSFSEFGDAGYGVSTPFGQDGHAFNLIYCQDGVDSDGLLDLYYIEPQTDNVWWLNYNGNGHNDYFASIWSGYWLGGLSSNIYWINYYNHFA